MEMDTLNGHKIPKCRTDVDQGVAEMQQYIKDRYAKLGLPAEWAELPDAEVVKGWFVDFARVAMDEIHRLETALAGQEAIVKSLNQVFRGW
jgi:hypothetical protein